MQFHVSTLNFSAGIDARTKHSVSKAGISLGNCKINNMGSERRTLGLQYKIHCICIVTRGGKYDEI